MTHRTNKHGQEQRATTGKHCMHARHGMGRGVTVTESTPLCCIKRKQNEKILNKRKKAKKREEGEVEYSSKL